MRHPDGTTAVLGGVRVVEASDIEAVQYAGRLLAALGADVVKTESPSGSALRERVPLAPGSDGIPSSIPFEFLNAGKKSVVLDAGSAADREHWRALVASADVVLWSADQDEFDPALAGERPAGQVRMAAGAFGADPAEPAPHTAFTRFHAGSSGYLVPADKDATIRPGASAPYVFEAAQGTAMAMAVLAELLRGTGGDVDFSMQAYGLWLDKMNFHQTSASGLPVHRYTHAYPFGGNMRCADGYACIFVIEEHQWHGLCRVLNHPQWISDPSLSDGVKRKAEQHRIDGVLQDWCAARSVDDVVELCRAGGVPVGRVRPPSELLEWDFFENRGFLRREETAFGEKLVPGFPFASELRPTTLGRAPRLGEHTREVLGALDGTARPSRSPVVSGGHEAAVSPYSGAPATGPLAGLRVLDFTWAAAGPIATSFMAFLGADVAKVEHRSRPDLMRVFAKQYGVGKGLDLDSSPAFNEIGAGKRSVELDLRDAGDRALALQLAAQADVVIENMRPGKMEKLGLSYEDIRAVNPGVVMCSQSAMGRVPGIEGVPGYAPIFWAESGGAWLTGWPGQRPGVIRAPVDLHAAAFALLGVLALLHRRETTGEGGYVDCSAIEACTAALGCELLEVQVGLPEPVRRGNAWPGYLFNDVLPCYGDDEWVAVSIVGIGELRTLCEVVGADADALTDLAGSGGPEVAEQLWERLATHTRSLDPARLEGRLIALGVPAVRSMSLLTAMSDARLEIRDTLQTVQTKHGEPQRIVGVPWTFDHVPYRAATPAPLMGEDTAAVQREWLHAAVPEPAVGDRMGSGQEVTP